MKRFADLAVLSQVHEDQANLREGIERIELDRMRPWSQSGIGHDQLARPRVRDWTIFLFVCTAAYLREALQKWLEDGAY